MESDAPDPVLAVASGWEPRVLVVDDDEIARFAAEQLLYSLGFTVDLAGDGREAVKMSARLPYVAIFMDCGMPEVDGYSAAREIRRSDGPSRHTLVIAMTSHARSVSIASGMDHHLAKPLRIDVLQADLTTLGLLARDGVRPTETTDTLAPDTPLLEPSVLDEIARGDRTRAAALMDKFIGRATVRLPELWRAANAGDLGTLRRLAHDLEGSATTVGAARVAELSRRLDRAAAHGARSLAAGIEPSLRQGLRDTAEAVTRYVEGGADSDSPEVRAEAEPSPQPTTDERDGEPGMRIRVAIADDDPLALFAVQTMIKRAGWLELVGAADGVEKIVEIAARERPEVVVLDWMMPGGGGAEAARRILYRNPDTRIVALTSSTTPAANAEMRSAGASHILIKGARALTLEHTIRRVLSTADQKRLLSRQQPVSS